MATAEMTETEGRELARAGRHLQLIEGAIARMSDLGIVRLEVVGPEDGDEAMLAYQLGVEDIGFNMTYAALISSVRRRRHVAGLLPSSTADHKPIDTNRNLLIASGLASIYNVRNPITGDGTELITINPSKGPQFEIYEGSERVLITAEEYARQAYGAVAIAGAPPS